MKSSPPISKLRDTSGASVVIALVFFLICAIIGSVVLTAASVQANAVATQQELKQQELVMSSAAQVIGEDMCSVKLVVGGDGSSFATEAESKGMARAFWGKYGTDVFKNVEKRQPSDLGVFSVAVASLGADYGVDPVDAKIKVGPDLSLTIDISMPPADGSAPLYNLRVFIQSIPTYDVSGNLLSATYEQPVVQKQDEVA